MAIRISAREARNRFADIMGSIRYGGEEVIVERSGRPMAALIPVDTYERLIAERRTRFELLDQIQSSLPDAPPEEIEKDVAQAIDTLRTARAKVVLDTNIFISSLLTKAGRSAMLIDAWRGGQYLLVTSRSIISEIKRVVNSPSIRKKYGLSRNQIERLVLLLEKDAIIVPGVSSVAGAIPEDPTDEMFLSAALDAKADLIVSSGRHLLDLGQYKDIPISTVRQFLELLEKK